LTSSSRWTFITNHGLVLSYISHNTTSTAREIAQYIGVTERTTHKIISDLEDAGYIGRRKSGRRNVYSVDPSLPLRHHTKKDVIVSELLEALTSQDLHEIMESNEEGDTAPAASPPSHPSDTSA
jgi:predicted transcriptional regulator of viral defense system